MTALHEHPGCTLTADVLAWQIPPEKVQDGAGILALLEASATLLDRLEQAPQ